MSNNTQARPNLTRPNLTQHNLTQALSEVRAYAKTLGMTFKRQNATVNGKSAYMLISRKTGEVVAKNLTLSTAYDSLQDGYFDEVAQNV